MNWQSFWTGVFSGALSSAVVALVFHWKAGKDLERTARSLRQLSILMLRALEQAGKVKFTQDEQGNYQGIVAEVSTGSVLDLDQEALAQVARKRDTPDAGKGN